MERSGEVVASGRITPGSGLVAEATAHDAAATGDLLAALFPPVTADVLSYYLPF